MRRAIRKHLADVVGIAAVVLVALGIGGYILSQQRVRFPLLEKAPLVIKVELPDAQAVQPGQGQTVRVAGIRVGDIGKVQLESGHAVVELQIDHKYEGLIREDATALLRAKTGLKDEFLEVDPGRGRPLKAGERIPLSNTAPDVDQDEILSALDSDTRDYLKLLIAGAGKGLRGRAFDLRETLRRLEPLHRDLARVAGAVAERRRNLRRLVNRYGLLVHELGDHGGDLTRLVRASNATLGAFAAEDQSLSASVSKLPASLRQTQSTLTKVDVLGRELGPALESLRPPFRRLPGANRELLPLAREGTPILRGQVRPFTRAGRPFVRDLGRAAKNLARATPDLTTAFGKLNRLANILAFNPGGNEGLTGQAGRDRARQEGYLYWLAWAGENGASVFSTADAQGVWRRLTLCSADPAALVSTLAPALSQLPAATQTHVLTALATSGFGGACP
jgi:phospholipid/cholesterol/gamma-HCH transport system substrate-binding protein